MPECFGWFYDYDPICWQCPYWKKCMDYTDYLDDYYYWYY